jgi:nucleotide-binding universal stress UspA family protein
MRINLYQKGVVMKKILVAHDGSDAADRALMQAAAIAQKFGSSLTIISVVPNLCFSEIGIDCDTVANLYRAEVEGVMEGVKEMLKTEGIEAETIILEGSPADVIVDHAKGMGMSLIAAGSTGKQATERTILGSVSSKVVANAPCPVLIVR